MILKINNEDYKMDFGFDFLAKLNDFYYAEAGGIRLNQGLNMAVIGLLDEDPEALVVIIMAGLATSDRKPSKKDIENFLIEEADKNEEGLNDLFGVFMDEIKKQPLLKGKVKKQLKQMKQAENKA